MTEAKYLRTMLTDAESALQCGCNLPENDFSSQQWQPDGDLTIADTLKLLQLEIHGFPSFQAAQAEADLRNTLWGEEEGWCALFDAAGIAVVRHEDWECV